MSTEGEKRLVLFDFDGTLTRYDSLFSFLRFFRGDLYFLGKIILALPTLVAYKLHILNGSDAKEKLLSIFLREKSTTEFRERCQAFGSERVPSILNKSITEKFNEHISNGDRVIIVSASVEDWIMPWAQQWGVEVVATHLAVEDGKLTGKFDGKNCTGEEKVVRIKSHLDLSDYDTIWAYGNSSGDEPMLELADHKVMVG